MYHHHHANGLADPAQMMLIAEQAQHIAVGPFHEHRFVRGGIVIAHVPVSSTTLPLTTRPSLMALPLRHVWPPSSEISAPPALNLGLVPVQ